MSRRKRRPETSIEPTITIAPPIPVLRCIHDLVEYGIFGADPAAVVERLVCERLQSIADDGWLDLDGYPAGNGD